MENKEKFEYTYSARQQSELEDIRKKYLPQDETKMDKLRRLDKSVTHPGTAAALAVGIIGTLIMGFGMCCVMEWGIFVLGVITGVFGMAVMGLAYPLYKCITKKKRERIAPEILKLTEEIERENFREK